MSPEKIAKLISGPGYVPVYCPITTVGAPEDVLAVWGTQRPDQGYDVLVVDDNHYFRGFVSRLFASRGFVVLAAGCPLKAMEYVAEQGGPKRMAVTDYRMPGAFGHEVADELRRIGFTNPIILMSDEDGAAEFAAPDIRFISKRDARSLADVLF